MKDMDLYRKFDGNTPWKDWAIGVDPDTNKLVVWFGRTGSRMQMREIDLKGEDAGTVRARRIEDQVRRDGYIYQGKCRIKNGYAVLTRSLGEEIAEAEIDDDPAVKAYWILNGDADAVLAQAAQLAGRLDEWVSQVQREAQTVRLSMPGYPDWTLDLTQDGRHNQGRIEAASGPVPLLIMLRLARDGGIQMARVDGGEIDPARLGADMSEVPAGPAEQETLLKMAERIGLIMPQVWTMDLESNDCWL